MKLKYQRALVAAMLAGIAVSASASAYNPDVFVDSPEACPSGYYPSVPSYELRNGHFVANGWLCQSLDDSSD